MKTKKTLEKRLLHLFTELYTYERNVHRWSFENFKENPPRYNRLKMITAIMKALELECSYEDFSVGEFIAEIHFEKWLDFLKDASAKFPTTEPFNKLDFEVDFHDLNTIFYAFMNYRLQAQSLLSCNSGILASTYEFNKFTALMKLPNKQLKKNLKPIDFILVFLINPKNISYSKQELIDKFDYPDVDLKEIDLDWI